MLVGFLILVIAVVIAFLVAEVAALGKWNGVWKLLAMIPAAVVLFVCLRIVLDTSRDPTSHNLWPLELVIWAGIGLASLGLLALVRAAGRARSQGV